MVSVITKTQFERNVNASGAKAVASQAKFHVKRKLNTFIV